MTHAGWPCWSLLQKDVRSWRTGKGRSLSFCNVIGIKLHPSVCTIWRYRRSLNWFEVHKREENCDHTWWHGSALWFWPPSCWNWQALQGKTVLDSIICFEHYLGHTWQALLEGPILGSILCLNTFWFHLASTARQIFARVDSLFDRHKVESGRHCKTEQSISIASFWIFTPHCGPSERYRDRWIKLHDHIALQWRKGEHHQDIAVDQHAIRLKHITALRSGEHYRDRAVDSQSACQSTHWLKSNSRNIASKSRLHKRRKANSQ